MQRISTQNMRGPYPRHAREIGFNTPDMREFVPLICMEKSLRSQPGDWIRDEKNHDWCSLAWRSSAHPIAGIWTSARQKPMCSSGMGRPIRVPDAERIVAPPHGLRGERPSRTASNCALLARVGTGLGACASRRWLKFESPVRWFQDNFSLVFR